MLTPQQMIWWRTILFLRVLRLRDLPKDSQPPVVLFFYNYQENSIARTKLGSIGLIAPNTSYNPKRKVLLQRRQRSERKVLVLLSVMLPYREWMSNRPKANVALSLYLGFGGIFSNTELFILFL